MEAMIKISPDRQIILFWRPFAFVRSKILVNFNDTHLSNLVKMVDYLNPDWNPGDYSAWVSL